MCQILVVTQWTNYIFKKLKKLICHFLVLSQKPGGGTIFRKPYARTVCNDTQ